MADSSTIEWTDATWNPVTGCTKISAGCKNCYAARLSVRLHAMGVSNYRNGFDVTTHESMLDKPYSWKKPRMVFVNSMSDLFHKDVPKCFIESVFKVMLDLSSIHTFQVLTKRSGRMNQLSGKLPWPENVWQGVTVESSDYIDRIDHLRECPAQIKFISFEPLLGPIGKVNLKGIDWVIVGGESGPHSRPIELSWITEIRDQCLELDIPFFFKQWGGTRKKVNGRLLDGRIWSEMPSTIN